MKSIFISFLFPFYIWLLSFGSILAQKVVRTLEEKGQIPLTKLEIKAIKSKKESAMLQKQLSEIKFSKSKIVTAEKFIGVDSIGSFELILIEESYTNPSSKEEEISTIYFEAKRAKKVEANLIFGFDSKFDYLVGEKQITKRQSVQRPASAMSVQSDDIMTCIRKNGISAYASCSNYAKLLSTCVKGCPKNKKGRPKPSCTLGCVIRTSPSGFVCYKDAVALSLCLIELFKN